MTVPAMFARLSTKTLKCVSALMRCGAQCIDDFYSEVRGKVLKGGISQSSIHWTQWPVSSHVHVMATSGGYDAQAESWEPLSFCLMTCCVVNGNGIDETCARLC